MIKLRAGLLAGALIIGAAGLAKAESNILFVLDASNSMWGQIDDIAKIETAKTALSRLLASLPADSRTALMVYGHREKSSCDDIELVRPFGSAASIEGTIETISPKGKTPIASSLRRSMSAFEGVKEGANRVVLISDRIESCQGNPCTAAQELAAADIDVRVHVVGFDISERDRAQLECIAEKGGGQYFSADDTEGFESAVTQAVQVAQGRAQPEPQPEPEPQPAKPVREQVFFDDFTDVDLSENWIVHNPDPDSYIVESGELWLLSTSKGSLGDPNTANIVNWDASCRTATGTRI